MGKYRVVHSEQAWGQPQARGAGPQVSPRSGGLGRQGGRRVRLRGRRDTVSRSHRGLEGTVKGLGSLPSCMPIQAGPLGGRGPCRGRCARRPGGSAAPKGRSGLLRGGQRRWAWAAVVQGAAVTHPPPHAGLARGEAVVLAPLQGRAPRHVPFLVVALPAAVVCRTSEPEAVHAYRSTVGAA